MYARNAPLYPMPEELPPAPSRGTTRFSRRDKELVKRQECRTLRNRLDELGEELRNLNREINRNDPPARYWSQLPRSQRRGNEGPIPYRMYRAAADHLEDLKIARADLVADVTWLQVEYEDCLRREAAARKAAIAAAKAEQARIIAERKEAARKKREQEQRERDRKRKEQIRAERERKRQRRQAQRQKEARREQQRQQAEEQARAEAEADAAPREASAQYDQHGNPFYPRESGSSSSTSSGDRGTGRGSGSPAPRVDLGDDDDSSGGRGTGGRRPVRGGNTNRGGRRRGGRRRGGRGRGGRGK